jgi:single-strand DNA-binding protein
MMIVQIAGHLGADPETRFTPAGDQVTTFRVAVKVRKKGKDETVWWRVTVFGKKFEKMMPYIKKGSGVIVVGDMDIPRIWPETSDQGRPQEAQLEMYAEMIKFSPFGKPSSDQSGNTQQYGAVPPPAQSPQPSQPAYSAQQSAYSSQRESYAEPSSFNGSSQYGGSASYAEDESIPF